MVSSLFQVCYWCYPCCYFLVAASRKSDEPDRAHYNLGVEYLEKGDAESVIIELRNVISLEPKFADAHYQLSLAYMKDLNGQRAMASMQRAISLDPENMDANLKMAGMLLLARQLDESQKYVMRVLNNDLKQPEALIIKATLALILNP